MRRQTKIESTDSIDEKIRKIEAVAEKCIAEAADPKDAQGHREWRDAKIAELRRNAGRAS